MGAYLNKPKTEKQYEYGESKNLTWYAMSMQGNFSNLGWRQKMEDSHIANTQLPNGEQIFGIFDGHGGREVAKYCQQNFVKFFTKNQNYQTKNYELAFTETFYELDKQMQSYEGQQELQNYLDTYLAKSRAGSTANIVLITDQEIICANAGDSRSIMLANNVNSLQKQMVELSFDHSLDDIGETERILIAGGHITDGRVNGNLNLTRGLGDFEYKQNKCLRPDQQIISSQPDFTKNVKFIQKKIKNGEQFLIIGCDGIFEKYLNEEICEFFNQRLNKQINTETILQQFLDDNLAEDASQGIGCDNMSIILIKFK